MDGKRKEKNFPELMEFLRIGKEERSVISSLLLLELVFLELFACED